MPVKSYLAYSAPDQAPQLAKTIAAIPGCLAVPAENRDAVVVITDTPSEDRERQLAEQLQELPGLDALTLVAAFAADDDLVSLTPQGARA
jgi:nitrate reductase NapAB chaperone NapD